MYASLIRLNQIELVLCKRDFEGGVVRTPLAGTTSHKFLTIEEVFERLN